VQTIRIVKAVMVATVGFWACLIAYGNVADYASNWAIIATQWTVWNGQGKAVMFVTCSTLVLVVLLLPEESA
jgi:predicted small integral membrane protein